MKMCIKCAVEKSEDSFYKTSGNTCKSCHNKLGIERSRKTPENGRQSFKKWYHASPENKAKKAKATKIWTENNKERDKENQHKSSLLRNYNLPYDGYLHFLDKQSGKCAICFAVPDRRLDVDHDHNCCPSTPTCGKCTRGLLCSNCNTAIGLLKESKELFTSALKYLTAIEEVA